MTVGKLLCVGNLGAGKSTLCACLSPALGIPFISIDAARASEGDGTAAGEARAWASFLRGAATAEPTLLECTGGGPFVHLLQHALRASGLGCRLLVVRTPTRACLERVRQRGLSVPYPDFGVPVEKVIDSVDQDLERQLASTWAAEARVEVDGTQDAAANAATVLRWLESTSGGPT